MRQSIVVLTLATIFATLTGGCMPNAESGISSFSPRSYNFLPTIMPNNSGSKTVH
jgi:hypothetical protein